MLVHRGLGPGDQYVVRGVPHGERHFGHFSYRTGDRGDLDAIVLCFTVLISEARVGGTWLAAQMIHPAHTHDRIPDNSTHRYSEREGVGLALGRIDELPKFLGRAEDVVPIVVDPCGIVVIREIAARNDDGI